MKGNNPCKPSNDGNVGNAILCLSRRVSEFAKELSRIQQELENLVQTETQIREEQLAQEQNRATEKENSLEENISQINENIQQTNEDNSEAFQSVTDFINQETQNRENAIQQQEQRAIEAENNLADSLNLDLSEDGSISVDKYAKTSCKHVYAAGDVTGGLKQWIVACGEGAVAAISAYDDLLSNNLI